MDKFAAMRVIQVDGGAKADWDGALLEEPYFALLQSWDWGAFKTQMGWQVYRLAVEDQGRILAGAQLLIKPLAPHFRSVAYVPRGPFGNWLEAGSGDLLLEEIHRLARLHGAVFTKIEPPLADSPRARHAIAGRGFVPTSLYNQPTATIVADLCPALDAVEAQMRRRTREYVRYSARKGVTVRTGGFEDLEAFTRIMRTTARREHFVPRTQEYYTNEWQVFDRLGETILLMAYFDSRLLAVHMAFRFGRHAAYFHGGSVRDFAQLRPNHLLVWEALKWAKAHGCDSYDLWGIPEEVGSAVAGGGDAPVSERTDDLWGVYHFKRGFSKNIVGYVGSWDFVYKPLLYKLITNRLLNASTVDGLGALFDSLR